MIDLDHAATTPLDVRVLEAMLPWLTRHLGNPASDHAAGRLARAAVEQARAQVAALVGATPAEIVWTSGATESNNLALKGALEFLGLKGAQIVTSRTEHKSVLDTCRHLETQGVRVTYLKPDAGGAIPAADVLGALTPHTALVSLMWVNNETGAINPVVELAPLLRERGVLFHVDAVQAAGRLPIDLAQVPIDLLSLSAHKFYGPKGVGALFVRKRPRARLAPQMHGGGHEQGMRSGTVATHQVVGMGAAAELAQGQLVADAARLAPLRDALATRLLTLPGVHLNGGPQNRAAHILNLSFEGVEGESLRALLPDLAVSSGSACSAATREPSYVLRALGRDDELAGASLRFSLGRGTTSQEIEQAAQQVIAAVTRLRSLASGAGPVPDAANGHDAYGYSAPTWRSFRDSRRAGSFAGDHTSLVEARAGSPAAKGFVRLQLRLAQGRVADARFQAYGCPATIAVGAWLAEYAIGRSLAEIGRIDSAGLRTALEIPEDRAHCALMGEDLCRALSHTPTSP
ncbi:MAG TPA: aminotransferase class V-fold PLP-dependent enzyme [Solimonas sp.]|nr:aminotransferase class V-fold PLP-dependent enzyme [Solimonas sp.]